MHNPNLPHDRAHLFSRPDRLDEPLYVITSVFNAVRYRTRWKLYQDYVRMVEASGAILYTVEVAFGDREFAITDACNPRHLQLRTYDELWHKERALNLLVQRLPADWKYLAWIDADVHFARSDWANEILHGLQHYAVLQPWSQSVDLSPQYEILRDFRSFAWSYLNDAPLPNHMGYYGTTVKKQGYWHPGYSAAWNRWAWDAVGGLMDWCVLGGADLFMWRALTGIDRHMPDSMGLSGIQAYEQWRNRADDAIKRNVGYTDGLLLHYWHGRKADRGYKDRGQILVDAKFDPKVDLFPASDGLWQLNRHNIELRDEIRKYFRRRSEDSIDV